MHRMLLAEGHKPGSAADASHAEGDRAPSDMMSKTRDPDAKIGVCRVLPEWLCVSGIDLAGF